MATLGRFSELLSSFIKIWDQYKLSLNELLNPKHEINSLNNYNLETVDVENKKIYFCQSIPETYCQNCLICCYIVILKHNMYQKAYPMLVLVYQYLLTIPISKVSCEVSFSVLYMIGQEID